MNNFDKQYIELVDDILENGNKKTDRTGTGTISLFGKQIRIDLREGFPLLTLRKIHIRSVIHELLWFLSSYDEKYDKFGNTNIRYLLDNGVTFWSEWPYENYKKYRSYDTGYPELTMKEFENMIINDDEFAIKFGGIGPGYGEQWLNSGSVVWGEMNSDGKRIIKKFEGINQIDNVIDLLKRDPDSRRIIVDAWNPMRLEEMLLPPCHFMFQFYSNKMTEKERMTEFNKFIKENNYSFDDYKKSLKEYNFSDRYLSLQLYIRSNDIGLGNPFNVAEYSLLLHMISQVVNMIPKEIIITIGDSHIYNNHITQLEEIIKRESFDMPKLELNRNIDSIYNFRFDDIKILDYESHPNIKMDVSV